MITQERYDKLLILRGFLQSTHEQLKLAKELEPYFLGELTGCSCKYNIVKSKLNNWYNTQGIKELEEYENNNI